VLKEPGRSDPAAQAALGLYRAAPLPVRAHVWLRWRTCPFPAVAAMIPRTGRVLDFGCGHGLFAAYLALGSLDREVTGVDVAPDKLRAARAAAGRAAPLGARVTFAPVRPGEVPEGPWAAVAVVDVLYLLDPDRQRRLLADLAGHLAPDGVLVVKEMARRPRWKFWWGVAQETLAVRVLRLTHGRHLTFVPPDGLAAWMRETGLQVSTQALDRGFVHPHHLVVGHRPGDRGFDAPRR
jgi:2-polyprenyl-3-methyl-5-hydroxy-6-metoxy-1,4-benzoquinol methylase